MTGGEVEIFFDIRDQEVQIGDVYAYLRKPLKTSFTLTLSLVLLLSLFAAVWAAFYSARRMVAPLQDLAHGTRAVADGDYETQLPESGEDEVGFLVESFNDMTRRLARARDEWQSAARNADRDLQRAYETALMDIVTKVDPVIQEFGKTNGYDFLIDGAQLAFSKEAHDVTSQLISKIDALYP